MGKNAPKSGGTQQNRQRNSPQQSKAPERQRPPENRGETMVYDNRRPAALSLMGLDKSDITLAAMLFLLYLESHDEDFLIILAIIAFSIFKSDKKDD